MPSIRKPDSPPLAPIQQQPQIPVTTPPGPAMPAQAPATAAAAQTGSNVSQRTPRGLKILVPGPTNPSIEFDPLPSALYGNTHSLP